LILHQALIGIFAFVIILFNQHKKREHCGISVLFSLFLPDKFLKKMLRGFIFHHSTHIFTLGQT